MSRLLSSPTSAERVLAPERCRALFARVERMCTGGGQVVLAIRSTWAGDVRWAQNEVTTGGETVEHALTITRLVRGQQGSGFTSGLDDEALLEAVERAEQQASLGPRAFNEEALKPKQAYLTVDIWREATYRLAMADRAEVHRTLMAPVRAAKLLSSGYLRVAAIANGKMNSAGLFAYAPETRAEYSVVVRDEAGTASGWAGLAHRDWTQLDAAALTARAIDKCQRSKQAVAIEPGRYTVVLEPQAVAELMLPLVESLDRKRAEEGGMGGVGPWARSAAERKASEPERLTRITERVLDPRLTLRQDPADPAIGTVPFRLLGDFGGLPFQAVSWVEQGVLKELSYTQAYARAVLNRNEPLYNSEAFQMSGGPTSVAEMIAATERGLLVTRFRNIHALDPFGASLLQGGTTSDGLWLIERGKVTTPVKNFRFRDSPLHAFQAQRLIALGTPVPTLMAQPTVVPPVHLREFNMAMLNDAV